MDKYVGKYRVVCEFDQKTLKPNKEDTYIYCANGGQIYRYNKDTLAYYRSGKNQANKVIKDLIDRGIEIIKEDSTPGDLRFYFNEKDIDKVAKIFKARTLGANINPTSKRNIKLFDWYKKP